MSLTMSIPVTFIVVLVGGISILLLSKKYTFPTLNIKNPWLAGCLLLLSNAAIIGITILLYINLIGSMLILEIISPLISILVWVWMKSSLKGGLKERFISSALGQTIYIVLFIYCIYQYVTLKPAYPGDDTFMAAIGLMMGMVVCFFATVIGLAIMLTSHPKAEKR